MSRARARPCSATLALRLGAGRAGGVPARPAGAVRPVKVPEGVPDERYLYLSDILPTAWQAVRVRRRPEGGTLAVHGLGPVGLLAARIAAHEGLPGDRRRPRPRAARARAADGVEVLDLDEVDDIAEAVLQVTGGRGPTARSTRWAWRPTGRRWPRPRSPPSACCPTGGEGAQRQGRHRPYGGARRLHQVGAPGGTVSVSGVYGGEVDPLPMMEMFDRGITLRLGQCHVRRWTDDIREVLDQDDDVLGVESLATHRVALEEAPAAYEMFQAKKDGCVKVVLRP